MFTLTRREKNYVAAALVLAAALGIVGGYYGGQAQLRSRNWKLPEGPRDCIDFRKAQEHLGDAGCVTGKILDVYTSARGNTFLNYCVDYRDCPFQAVIFSEDRNKFGNLATLLGREVELTGAIEFYQGRAEIKIRDPVQVRVLP